MPSKIENEFDMKIGRGGIKSEEQLQKKALWLKGSFTSHSK